LAYHAALPLVLTPELLNYLRTKFLLNQVPWTAEADLLLSKLCREVGYGLYVMDLPVRNFLLREMRFIEGTERMTEVARLLLSYIHQVTQSGAVIRPDELQAERWAAMAYLDDTRGKVVNELVKALWDCVLIEAGGTGNVKGINWTELTRLLSCIQEITPQISDYPELIKYAELTGKILADHSGEQTLELLQSNLLSQEIRVNGQPLPTLDILVDKKRYSKIAAAAIVHNKTWTLLQESFRTRTPINGQVIGQNSGGLLVDVGGIITFLPTSQIDIRPISNLSAFRNHELEALVIEISKEQGRIVISRKALIEENEKIAFDKALEGLEEGMIVEGTIMTIFDHGAFVNFGGELDALLHVSEMSWGFVPHPSNLFSVGETLEAKVITLDREARKIELSYRELIPNPWLTANERYSVGTWVRGKVVGHNDDWLFIELEPHIIGRVSLSELQVPLADPSLETLSIGKEVEALIVDIHAEKARIMLSFKQSLEAVKTDIPVSPAWKELERIYNEGMSVKGRITDRTKGGLIVNVMGIKAFLPSSQVDIRPVRNLESLRGQEIEVKVIKLNRERSNIVLSRKAFLEEENQGKKGETLNALEEGIIVEGQIKNLTDYGAFVDLGGIDGLLHVTDMSWGRLQNPSEMFRVGENVQVKVLKFDKERERVSLGYKQLLPDPWESVIERFPAGLRMEGKIASVTDYGAFIELEPGVEGLVHASEMTWSKRVKLPSTLVKVGDTVEVQVLGADPKARRISLGMKQTQPNPWESLPERYHVGDRVRGRVRNLTDFGAFVEVEDGVDGLVHVSDISWNQRIKHPGEMLKKGQEIEAVITNIDVDNRRLSLSIKDTGPNLWDEFIGEHKPGDIVRGKVTRFTNFGVFVELAEGLEGLCHVSELTDEQVERPEDAVQIGQELDFRILHIEPESKKIGLSARVAEEHEILVDNKEPAPEENNVNSTSDMSELSIDALTENEDQ
jgi:small subunit ribosomal protein S1